MNTSARASTKKPRATGKSTARQSVDAVPCVDHDLENAIPYLVARAGMRMGQAFAKQIKPFGLTLMEWRVCVALQHKPHQRLAELARHTSSEPSTLSRILDGLMRRKLIVRDRCDADARALALSLTPAGVELTQRIIPIAQVYERVALAGIPPAQVQGLREMLRRIYDNTALLDPAP